MLNRLWVFFVLSVCTLLDISFLLENKGLFCFSFSLGVHQLYHTDTFSYFMHVCVCACSQVYLCHEHALVRSCMCSGKKFPMSVITMQVSHFAVLFMIILLKPCWDFFNFILSSIHVQYHVYIHICVCVSEKGWRRSSEFSVADSIWKWVSVSCSRCRVTALSPPPPLPPPRKLVPALTFDVGQPIVCSRHYWWTAARDFLLLFFPGFKKKAEKKSKQKSNKKTRTEQKQSWTSTVGFVQALWCVVITIRGRKSSFGHTCAFH